MKFNSISYIVVAKKKCWELDLNFKFSPCEKQILYFMWFEVFKAKNSFRIYICLEEVIMGMSGENEKKLIKLQNPNQLFQKVWYG